LQETKSWDWLQCVHLHLSCWGVQILSNLLNYGTNKSHYNHAESSGMMCHVIWYKFIYVFEEHTATIFRLKSMPNKTPARSWWQAKATCLALFSTLQMEAVCTRTSETSVNYQTTRYCIPEDGTLHNHCWTELQIWCITIMFAFLNNLQIVKCFRQRQSNVAR
jgi:hypothetical protein